MLISKRKIGDLQYLPTTSEYLNMMKNKIFDIRDIRTGLRGIIIKDAIKLSFSSETLTYLYYDKLSSSG